MIRKEDSINQIVEVEAEAEVEAQVEATLEIIIQRKIIIIINMKIQNTIQVQAGTNFNLKFNYYSYI